MKNKTPNLSRRSFIKSSAAFGALSFLPSYIALGNKSSTGLAPSEKVNLAVIGIGNRGDAVRRNLLQSGLCNVVALCDVDLEGEHTHASRYSHGLTNTPPSAQKGKETPEVYPLKARAFTDFRKMFDTMADEIDAVLIATPDHSHFAATMMAMSLGKHVYVEKPLAHTFGQTSRLMDFAERSGVVTQMGNQGHSGANYFQFKAWTEAGLLNGVKRITANMNNPRRWHGWGTNVAAYYDEPLPNGVDWEQWLDSTAASHPYSKRLHPAEWRSWYNYGSGCFGDWGPHILDTCHRFLKLGLPHTVSAVMREGVNAADLVYPQATTIRFDFAKRSDDMPACEVTWHDGVDNMPQLESEYTDDGKPITFEKPGKTIYAKDLIFRGGSHERPLQVLPKSKYMDIRRSLPRFPQKNSNHYANFLLACKGEEESRSPFSISGELTQVFNLGVLAQRFGGDIKFDAKQKRITNNKTADALLDPAPRKGWEEYYAL